MTKWFKIAVIAAVFVAVNAALVGVALQSRAEAPTDKEAAYVLPEGVERYGVSDIRRKTGTD